MRVERREINWDLGLQWPLYQNNFEITSHCKHLLSVITSFNLYFMLIWHYAHLLSSYNHDWVSAHLTTKYMSSTHQIPLNDIELYVIYKLTKPYPICWIAVVRVQSLHTEEPRQQGAQTSHVPLVRHPTTIRHLPYQESERVPRNNGMFHQQVVKLENGHLLT